MSRSRDRFPDIEALTASTYTLKSFRFSGIKTNSGATGTVTATLPAASQCKGLKPVRFLRTAAQTFTVAPAGTEFIYDRAGASLGAGVAYSMTTAGAMIQIASDGTSWYVLEERGAVLVAGDLAAGAVTTTKLGAAAVVGTKLGVTGIVSGGFTGSNGTGACTFTGATVGQRVLAVMETTATVGPGVAAALFETTITIADQIQQSSAANNSAKRYVVILLPVAA